MNDSTSALDISRIQLVRRGLRLEYVTVIWNSLEGLIAIGAGVVAVASPSSGSVWTL